MYMYSKTTERNSLLASQFTANMPAYDECAFIRSLLVDNATPLMLDIC